MRLPIISTLLAGVAEIVLAEAAIGYPEWTLGLPSNSYVNEGTDLVVTWDSDGETGTFRLTLETHLTVPIIRKDGMNDVYDFQQIYHVLSG